MSFTGTTLEDFIEDQCGMVTPKLLELLDPHRGFVEQALKDCKASNQSWKEFTHKMWKFLPEPTPEHFKPQDP